METQSMITSFNDDYFVFHSQDHDLLAQEEIAKAVGQHEREHPSSEVDPITPAAPGMARTSFILFA